MRKVLLLCFCFFLSSLTAVSAEKINFQVHSLLTAGKACLTENGYVVSRTLDTANFSPELRLPVQLVYRSASEKTGIFGYAWSSPQLESSAKYDKDGVLWTTPWGEKIKFYPKNEKLPKDAVKVELYEQAKKGRGFYAPYTQWEADTTSGQKHLQESGNWTFSGKNAYRGWKFVYRDAKLYQIQSPNGRQIQFSYANGLLKEVLQSDQAFIELSYSGNTVTGLKINGIDYVLSYRQTKLQILPKTESGKLIAASRPCLVSIRRGDLNPMEFSYDDYGFLNQIRQGDYADVLEVAHQSAAQRKEELLARKGKKKYSGAVNGRILADADYKYAYSGDKAGSVKLTDKLGRKASYDLNENTGVFRLTEFSGRSFTIKYFMRHDVAYLGKIRCVTDSRGRDVMDIRYDRFTGNILRIRDMAGNDINYSYTQDADLKLITRRADDQDDPEPVVSFRYQRSGFPSAVSQLNAKGKPVVTTNIQYDVNAQPLRISNGQSTTAIHYNRFGYPDRVEDTFGLARHFQMDPFNRLTCAADHYGVKTYYTYTPAGLVSKIERKDGDTLLNSIAVIYNGNGQPVSYTDQSGKTKKFERDAFGRVVKEFFPDDTSVEYSYNKLGQLHTVLDQNRHQITFNWDKFGLGSKRTPAGQLTDYVHDKYGLLTKVDSKWKNQNDRSIKYEYDKYDRVSRINYGGGDVEELKYDSWGRLLSSRRGSRVIDLKYDYFGRVAGKKENDMQYAFIYNPWGQRTVRTIRKKDGSALTETRTYDRYGRLIRIKSGGREVHYVYNSGSQIARQIINGVPVEFTYNKYGQLLGKKMLKKTDVQNNNK